MQEFLFLFFDGVFADLFFLFLAALMNVLIVVIRADVIASPLIIC